MADEVKAKPDQVVDLTDAGEVGATAPGATAPLSPAPDPVGSNPWRRALAVVLAVLAIIATVLAVDAVWVQTTLENEDQFVSTLEPLLEEEAIVTALSLRVAHGIVEGGQVEAGLAERLPEELSSLAVVIAEAVERAIASVANQFLQSDAGATVWSNALRATHVAVGAILSGNEGALESEGGQVSINLDEVAATVVERLAARGIDLPDVETSLGSVVVFESERLATAQKVAEGINTAGWLLPVIALVLIVLALAAAVDRRRMVAFLGFGTAVGALLSLTVGRVAHNTLLGGIEDEGTREAATAVWDTIASRRISALWALLVLGLIVGFLAWAAGPSTRAAQLRAWGSGVLDDRRRPADATPTGFSAFLADWRRVIQVGVVVLGLLFILFGPAPSGLLVILTAVVVLAIVVVVEVMAGPAPKARAPS